MHKSESLEIVDRERAAKLRMFFARFVTQRGGALDPRIEQAFAAVPREPFAGPPPWFTIGSLPLFPAVSAYTQTPDDDPAFLYQDVLIALDRQRGINIGEPSLHAFSLAAIAIRESETVVHVGCGSGYYTAVIASLVGPHGRVHAFEIDIELAARANVNLLSYPTIDLHQRSGADVTLPAADAIYVNAACTQPEITWLKALKPGGRLLLPLQPARGLGGMLLIRRPHRSLVSWHAKFITRAVFIAGQGLQDAEADCRLADAFESFEAWQRVCALRFDEPANGSCWLRGDGWWLSTSFDDSAA